ncbi:MAG: hypothetical protein C0409_07755 [Novosphingobium sp.]|nr:hypothetical protein [Novosphingobium sp.]
MIIVLPDHPHPPAESLFCRAGDACEHRPAISMKVRESFAANFAADFAAAMTEHRHENDDRKLTAA